MLLSESKIHNFLAPCSFDCFFFLNLLLSVEQTRFVTLKKHEFGPVALWLLWWVQ